MLETNKIYNEDCLGKNGMSQIEDGSIDMIVCDLPYGTMKGAGLDGWKNQTTEWDEQLNIKEMFKQYERICRENANIILFSQEPYTYKLRSYNAENIKFAYPLIWEKDHFANALIAKKAPVSYFEDLSVFYKKYDTQNINPLRTYFKNVAEYIGVTSCKQINEKLGHRRAEHSFYVFGKGKIKECVGQKADYTFRTGSTQFKLCTEETYKELISVFHIDKMEGFKAYAELNKINLKYQKIFNLPEGQKFKSNALKYNQGLHPTQKPVALIEDLIKTYTNEGNVILDNCIGSGTTAIACINTNRKYIGFELDKKYYDIAVERVAQRQKEMDFYNNFDIIRESR